MHFARRWLPPQAYQDGVIEDRIGQQVSIWLDEWIGSATRGDLPVRAIDGPMHFQAAERVRKGVGDQLVLTMPTDGQICLGFAMLGIAQMPDRPNDRDKNFLGRLAEQAMDALFAHLERFFGCLAASAQLATEGSDQQNFTYYRIEIFDGASLAMGLSQTLQTSLRLDGLPVSDDCMPGQIKHALWIQSVDVEAFVGRARISVDDVRGLGVGDVLILDRHLTDHVDLVIDGHALQPHCARINKGEKGVELKLMASHSEGVV